jgi:peptide/nickel transport system permease protein
MAMLRPVTAAPRQDTALPEAPTAGQPTRRGRAGLRRLVRAVRSNRKATVGAALLALFCLVALFPGVIGTRQVLLIAVGVGLLATVIAMLIGVAAAFYGGLWDGSLSLLTDVLLVIPLFPLLIVIATYVQNAGTMVLVVVLTLTGWSYTARQLRAQALSLRNRDFLMAARVRGERKMYIVLVEIIPTMTSLLVACFLTNALYAVLFSAGLQFIGLGDPNSVSWGTMLYWAENNEALQTGQYLWAIVPGACIVALGAAFALLNYAFDEIGNPALRPVRRIRVKRAG